MMKMFMLIAAVLLALVGILSPAQTLVKASRDVRRDNPQKVITVKPTSLEIAYLRVAWFWESNLAKIPHFERTRSAQRIELMLMARDAGVSLFAVTPQRLQQAYTGPAAKTTTPQTITVDRDTLAEVMRTVVSEEGAKLETKINAGVDARFKEMAPADDANKRQEIIRAAQSLDMGERSENLKNSPLYKRLSQPHMRDAVNGLGNYIRGNALRARNFSPEMVADHVEKQFRDPKTAGMIRALNTQVGSAGGVLIPLEYDAQFIDMLRSALMFNTLGVQYTTLSSGKKRFRKRTAKVRAEAFAEGNNIKVKEGAFGYVDLNAKDIGVIVPVTNDMLNDGDFDTNVLVVTDVITELALEIERQALFGAGGTEILGLVNYPNVEKFNGTSGAGSARANLQTLDGKYWDADPLDRSTALAFHPRLKVWGKYVATSTGDLPRQFGDVAQGLFAGYKFAASTQMPYNSGSGAAQVIMGDWGDFVVGMGSTEVTTSQDATVVDQNGNTISAFQANMTLVRAIQRADAVPTREQVFKVMTIPNIADWLWV